jgi:hypothetical protein
MSAVAQVHGRMDPLGIMLAVATFSLYVGDQPADGVLRPGLTGKGSNIPGTGIPLSEIKEMFEKSPCERLFLILNFCHSGAILARGASTKASEEPETTLSKSCRSQPGRTSGWWSN